MRGAVYTTSCQRLGEHFSLGPCKGCEYFVQVVEKMSGNGRIGKEVDPQITKERRKREDQWMLKVDTTGVVGQAFPSLQRSLSLSLYSSLNSDNFLTINFALLHISCESLYLVCKNMI